MTTTNELGTNEAGADAVFEFDTLLTPEFSRAPQPYFRSCARPTR